MEHNKQMPAVALGTWSWGTGAVGGDQVFGNHLSAEDLKPVFDAAMEQGLNLTRRRVRPWKCSPACEVEPGPLPWR